MKKYYYIFLSLLLLLGTNGILYSNSLSNTTFDNNDSFDSGFEESDDDAFTNDSDTKDTADDFSSKGDEFGNNNSEFGESEDDLSEGNEFSEFGDDEELTETKPTTNWNRFNWALGILFATFIAGLFVKNNKLRKLRPVFLLAAVVILGFYRGGPGIISSFQNTLLFVTGISFKWTAIVLFVGVIVLSYFQGKVFCGWICYLGAIQEFLYIGKIKVMQTEKAQKIMRIIRYILLVAISLQLIITQTIEWSRIGPFKVIFNLYSPNITGYVLLGVLLLSSLFIHRPFCKLVCPAGLIFGWVTKIPGASVLGITTSCAGCKTCNTSCNINAITREDNTSKLDNQECIMCGECMSDCKIKSIQPFRKGAEHKGSIVLKGIKKIK